MTEVELFRGIVTMGEISLPPLSVLLETGSMPLMAVEFAPRTVLARAEVPHIPASISMTETMITFVFIRI